MIVVKAGAAVDAVIEQLLPPLEPDDIVIDSAGNSAGSQALQAARVLPCANCVCLLGTRRLPRLSTY
ncbi:MAG TPA: NAD(P)-binding domain-containing protein [Rubrivivax sp.]|nr:NAD(P)-binding domain-containing protein [Rubrivivax sp.]